MYVTKLNGRKEAVLFDKIIARIKKQTYGLSIESCDPVRAAGRGWGQGGERDFRDYLV